MQTGGPTKYIQNIIISTKELVKTQFTSEYHLLTSHMPDFNQAILYKNIELAPFWHVTDDKVVAAELYNIYRDFKSLNNKMHISHGSKFS